MITFGVIGFFIQRKEMVMNHMKKWVFLYVALNCLKVSAMDANTANADTQRRIAWTQDFDASGAPAGGAVGDDTAAHATRRTVPPSYASLAGTDTELLLEAVGGSPDALDHYINTMIKPTIIRNASIAIDGMVSTDTDNLLDAAAILHTSHAGNPVDRTRGAFKVALAARINGLHDIGVTAPADANIGSLNNCKESIITAVETAVNEWIDGIILGDDAVVFLDEAAFPQRDHYFAITKSALKYALAIAISR